MNLFLLQNFQNDSVDNAVYTSMRHVQVRYDLAGKEETEIVKTVKMSNLTEGSTQVFHFEFPPMSPLPDSIKVPRNLSVINNGNESLTVSIAYADYYKKPLWICNTEKNSTYNIFATKRYFSHFEGIGSDGKYANIVDYIEFFDENSGNTVNGFKSLPVTILFLIVTLVKQNYFW